MDKEAFDIPFLAFLATFDLSAKQLFVSKAILRVFLPSNTYEPAITSSKPQSKS